MYNKAIGDMVKMNEYSITKLYEFMKNTEKSNTLDSEELAKNVINNCIEYARINNELLEMLKQMDGDSGTYKIIDGTEESNTLDKINATLDSMKKMLGLEIVNSKQRASITVDNTELNSEVRRLLGLFEGNVKAIAASQHMKDEPMDMTNHDAKNEDIIRLAELGYSNEAIGREIGVCGNTVKKRLQKMDRYTGKKVDYKG